MKELFLRFHKAVKEVERLHTEIEQDSGIRICGGYNAYVNPEVQIHKGIDTLSVYVNIPIFIDNENYPRKYFDYDGVRYFTLIEQEASHGGEHKET